LLFLVEYRRLSGRFEFDLYGWMLLKDRSLVEYLIALVKVAMSGFSLFSFWWCFSGVLPPSCKNADNDAAECNETCLFPSNRYDDVT